MVDAWRCPKSPLPPSGPSGDRVPTAAGDALIYSFGEYELDTRLHELRRAGDRLHVEPQVFAVLAHLFAARDRVVPKETEVTERDTARPHPAPSPRQSIHFCTSDDGVRIAYATSGSGPPLVKPAHWLTHVEYDWESPVWRHGLRELSRDHTLIRYDQHGSGLWNTSPRGTAGAESPPRAH